MASVMMRRMPFMMMVLDGRPQIGSYFPLAPAYNNSRLRRLRLRVRSLISKAPSRKREAVISMLSTFDLRHYVTVLMLVMKSQLFQLDRADKIRRPDGEDGT